MKGKYNKLGIIAIIALCLAVFHVKQANAMSLAGFTMPYSYGGHTYTDYMAGCENGSSLTDCSTGTFYIFFFNSTATYNNSPTYTPYGSGSLTAIDPDANYGYTVSYHAPTDADGRDFQCSDSSLTSCSTYGNSGFLAVTDGATYNKGATNAWRSTRTIISSTSTPIADTTTRTRFVSVTPAYGSNVATGTVTVSVVVFIHPDDLVKAGGHMRFNSVAAQIDPAINGNISPTSVDINVSGYSTITGTSTIGYPSIWNDRFTLTSDDNPYWLNKLENAGLVPSFLQGGVTTYISTSTYFAVGNLSPAMQNRFNQTVARHGYSASTTAAYDLANCSPIAASGNAIGMSFNSNFNLEDCLYNLVVPSNAGMQEISDDATSGFLAAAPFGYMVRLMDLFNTSTSTDATTTIPVVAYTFPDSFPVFGGFQISFDVYSYMAQAADLENNYFVSSTSGKNMWQIFEPIIKLLVAFALLFKIISEITGLEIEMSPAQDTKVNGHVTDDTYRYKEKLYQMSKRRK